MLGLDFGATNVYTNEKCRIRWAYLHCQRKLGKSITYKSIASASESDGGNKENTPVNKQKKQPKVDILDPRKLLEAKSFDNVTSKTAPKSMSEIEANMWKANIKEGPRARRDFLDASSEDFSLNTTKSVEGKEITPSSFNIFRDSLRKASERLLETLNDNLPDMNLKDIEESESEREHEREQLSEEDDVLPLDFRTALIEKDNRVVIQAKPLSFKADGEEDRPVSIVGARSGPGLDAYLEMVRKEAFKEDEGAVMLDPDINIKEKFDLIDLPCNTESRMNNAINAPKRVQRNVSTDSKKRVPKMPKNTKTYDTDTASDSEQIMSSSKPKIKNVKDSKTLDQAQKLFEKP